MLISDTDYARMRLAAAVIPKYCRDGLLDYLRYGVPPGHFLQAVLSNDFAEACARADAENRAALYDYMFFLYTYAPHAAWGSPLKVRQWIEAGMALRRQQMQESR